MISTPTGIAAAKEFGSRLPHERNYRLFHTYVHRAKETADAIREGISSMGGNVEAGEIVPFKYSVDRVGPELPA
jgi:broad specificity phosphatase PhoE